MRAQPPSRNPPNLMKQKKMKQLVNQKKLKQLVNQSKLKQLANQSKLKQMPKTAVKYQQMRCRKSTQNQKAERFSLDKNVDASS
mmetsp:Transcript_1676/g.3908  ORF Transcript_1676/g.3908 Transcript_1676/m.3908 type:complete len:84 (+) Transcript_1676:1358-1609(+)